MGRNERKFERCPLKTFMAFTTNGIIAIERIGKPMCFSQLVQNFYMIYSLVMSLCLNYVRGLALLLNWKR